MIIGYFAYEMLILYSNCNKRHHWSLQCIL